MGGAKLAAPMHEAAARHGLAALHQRAVGHSEAVKGDRLLHDSATGPARSARPRRCPACGRRRKYCRCAADG